MLHAHFHHKYIGELRAASLHGDRVLSDVIFCKLTYGCSGCIFISFSMLEKFKVFSLLNIVNFVLRCWLNIFNSEAFFLCHFIHERITYGSGLVGLYH